MVRLSFADATALIYRHVLLVEPTSNTDFAVVTGHGHGMTWVDNRLYVATADGVIRVFDTSHFWKVDDSAGNVGLGSDGKYHAAFYDYALPQIGAFWYPGGGCTTAVGDRSCVSTLSFDASSSSFVTAEQRRQGKRPRGPLAVRPRGGLPEDRPRRPGARFGRFPFPGLGCAGRRRARRVLPVHRCLPGVRGRPDTRSPVLFTRGEWAARRRPG